MTRFFDAKLIKLIKEKMMLVRLVDDDVRMRKKTDIIDLIDEAKTKKNCLWDHFKIFAQDI